MNDPNPAWQNTFPANPGEAYNLQELHDIDESTIDPEFLSDFRPLKTTSKTQLTSLTQNFSIVSKLILVVNAKTSKVTKFTETTNSLAS